MSEIRKLPAVEDRVETGSIQFGDDWPGTFIRGDNALNYAYHLRTVLQKESLKFDYINKLVLESLLDDLEASSVRNEPHV